MKSLGEYGLFFPKEWDLKTMQSGNNGYKRINKEIYRARLTDLNIEDTRLNGPEH
jgi:hypothetical protein